MITQLHTSYMRQAAASSCAMRMHLVLQNTGEQRSLSLLVHFNSTGLLAHPRYYGVDQTCLSFASSRLLRLSTHSIQRVECYWATRIHLKYSLCLYRTRPRKKNTAFFIFELSDFHRYLQSSLLSRRISYENPIVAIKRQSDLIFRAVYRCNFRTWELFHSRIKSVTERHK